MKKRKAGSSSEMRKQYAFSQIVRGKHAKRYKEGASVQIINSADEKTRRHKDPKSSERR